MLVGVIQNCRITSSASPETTTIFLLDLIQDIYSIRRRDRLNTVVNFPAILFHRIHFYRGGYKNEEFSVPVHLKEAQQLEIIIFGNWIGRMIKKGGKSPPWSTPKCSFQGCSTFFWVRRRNIQNCRCGRCRRR